MSGVATTAGFDARDFTRGFIAALVLKGASSLQPMNPVHRQGLYRVWDYLESEARKAEQSSDRGWFKSLVRIRNRVDPGQTGAFDQFQTDLRDLQLSLTESPNPSYEDIAFSLSRPFADSLLEQLGGERSDLVRAAVEVFLGGEATNNDASENH